MICRLWLTFTMGVNSDFPLWVGSWLSIYICIVWVQKLALLSHFPLDPTMLQQ
jgi:hypothetical protein